MRCILLNGTNCYKNYFVMNLRLCVIVWNRALKLMLTPRVSISKFIFTAWPIIFFKFQLELRTVTQSYLR